MEEKKSGIKKFLEEFKAFAMRGNVLDMAVGVVIGGAFTAIVTALVEDIINPLIGLFFKADFSDVVIGLGGSSIKIGEFVNSIINFLIVAFVLFVVIKFVNSLHKKPEAPAEPEEPKPLGVTVAITGGSVYVRVGNGTNYRIITTVKAGMTFDHIATARNGWNAIVINGQVGWVSGKYSKVI